MGGEQVVRNFHDRCRVSFHRGTGHPRALSKSETSKQWQKGRTYPGDTWLARHRRPIYSSRLLAMRYVAAMLSQSG